MKKKFMQILAALGLTDKAKAKSLDEQDWRAISTKYNETFAADFFADVEAEEQAAAQAQAAADANAAMARQYEAAMAILATEESAAAAPDTADGAPVAPDAPLATQVQSLIASNRTQAATIATLQTQVNTMATQALPDRPAATVGTAAPAANVFAHTETHLYGITHDAFARGRRHVDISINADAARASLSNAELPKVERAFHADLARWATDLADRFAFVKQNKIDPAAAASDPFVTTVTSNAGLGDQYMVRRQDALIARILSAQESNTIFTRRYGIQDREMITNAFFEEISQAYQKGHIFKGAMTLQPEYGYVDDAMMKISFAGYKELERMYLGYLNTDGSDPIKWSMIEFVLLNSYIKMTSEQNVRRVMGIYVKPEAGKPGRAINAATGFLYTLVRYVHENKLLLNDDAAFAGYTSANMLDAIQAFVEDVREKAEEPLDIESLSIFLNANHRHLYLKCCRAEYGKDLDFNGPGSFANRLPDSNIAIVWVPNLGQLPLMVMTEPSNFQSLEFLPGEMLAVKITEDMEEVKLWSTWKEGFSAAYVGRQFPTLAALKANGYKDQRVFANKPAVELAADATTIAAGNGFWFRSVANTAATTLTDITAAVPGRAYIIECGNTANATKVAKSGKFDAITAAWTPTAVGDYLMVIGNADGDKFLELERAVGGVRTINTALQPNLPGAR